MECAFVWEMAAMCNRIISCYLFLPRVSVLCHRYHIFESGRDLLCLRPTTLTSRTVGEYSGKLRSTFTPPTDPRTLNVLPERLFLRLIHMPLNICTRFLFSGVSTCTSTISPVLKSGSGLSVCMRFWYSSSMVFSIRSVRTLRFLDRGMSRVGVNAGDAGYRSRDGCVG